MKKGTQAKKEDARQQPSAAPKSAVTRSMRVRAALMAGLFVFVGFGAVIYNLYQLQIVQHEELATRAENQQLADEMVLYLFAQYMDDAI